MGNVKDIDFTDIQRGNWNIAKPYTTEKILKWLVQIDIYQTIAMFGTHEMINDIVMKNENLKNFARTKALRRWIHSILTLIHNTKFAINKKDKPKFEEYIKRLKLINDKLPLVEDIVKRGNRIDTFNIKEKLFNKITDELNTIMDDINERLNKADLIFTHKEEFDYKKAKNSYKEEFSVSG